MVVIHLARAGRKNRPFYHIVVQSNTAARDGRYIERLGHYNPLDDTHQSCTINLERYDYWCQVGARVSPRVASLAKNAKRKQNNEQKAS